MKTLKQFLNFEVDSNEKIFYHLLLQFAISDGYMCICVYECKTGTMCLCSNILFLENLFWKQM